MSDTCCRLALQRQLTTGSYQIKRQLYHHLKAYIQELQTMSNIADQIDYICQRGFEIHLRTIVEYRAVRLDSVRGTNGDTPLETASRYGRTEMVELLVNLGACVNGNSDDKYSPLMWASYNGRVETTKRLITLGAEINRAHGSEGQTALFLADNRSLVEALIFFGADPNKTNSAGETPLCVAASHGLLEACRALLKCGADPAIGAPIEKARARGHDKIVQAILNHLSINISRMEEFQLNIVDQAPNQKRKREEAASTSQQAPKKPDRPNDQTKRFKRGNDDNHQPSRFHPKMKDLESRDVSMTEKSSSQPSKPSIKPQKLPVILPKIEKQKEQKKTTSNEVFLGNKNTQSNFEEYGAENGLSPQMVKCVTTRLGMAMPTMIQRLAIPVLLGDDDAMVKALTGSGKTLTYLIPIMQKLSENGNVTRSEGTFAVIIAPTRELCQQILATLTKMCMGFTYIVPTTLTGGESKQSEKARLRKGATIVVATPGRLLDHLNTTQSFRTDNLKFLILDEADRLLDMGFEENINTIVQVLRERAGENADKIQSALISATLNNDIQRLAGVNLRNPKFVDAEAHNKASKEQSNQKKEAKKNSEQKSMEVKDDPKMKKKAKEEEVTDDFLIPKQLKQHYMIVPDKQRLVSLAAFIRWKAYSETDCKMIVFISNCDSVDFHYALFGRTFLSEESQQFQSEKLENPESEEANGVPLFPFPMWKLHGNLTQLERSRVYKEYSKTKSGVLLCTDVAARGVDFPGINWIVQYDAPEEPKEYIHRVGRTARIGAHGNSLLFLLPEEKEYVELLKGHKLELKNIPMEQAVHTLDPSRHLKKIGFGSAALQLFFERKVVAQKDLSELARQGFTSFIRAYSVHTKDTRHIFDLKNLHLGHIAKSFALREAPSTVLSMQSSSRKKEKRSNTPNDKEARMKAAMKSNMSSEFSSGF